MRRPGYANVVATLALVVALGGTSYAAVQVTGKDVKNGSLSSKDVKNESLKGKDVKDESLSGSDLQKQSVPLDRLNGSLPTQLDPGQFVPAAGPYTVSVGQGAWQTTSSRVERGNAFGLWVSTVPNTSTALILDPAIPTTVAGKSMRLNAVTLCWDATLSAMKINQVLIRAYQQDAGGNEVAVVETGDLVDHTDKICKRYAFPTPVTLVGSSRVSLGVAVVWTATGSTIRLGGATFELDRA